MKLALQSRGDMLYVGRNTKNRKNFLLLIYLPTVGQWTIEISPIVNAYFFFKKNKPTQGYLVCGLVVRGGTCYILAQIQRKRFFVSQFTNSDTMSYFCMYMFFLKINNPTQDFLITMAFRSGGDTKSDFSLTRG